MKRDHYEVLGVRQSATDASIRRAIQAARDQIDANASLSTTERNSRLNELVGAADVLTSPPRRDQYDAALRQVTAPDTRSGMATLLAAPRTWIILIVVAAIGGGLYWQYERAQTAQRIERERIVAERQQVQRLKEVEARRESEKQRLEEELREQKLADDKQRQEVNEIRSAESQKKQYVADDRYIPPPPTYGASSYESARRNDDDQRQMSNDARQREMEERRQRYEEESNMRRAKAEVERQKRYLDNIEREEQYARARREADSRPTRY